jgi:hypothetical protein
MRTSREAGSGAAAGMSLGLASTGCCEAPWRAAPTGRRRDGSSRPAGTLSRTLWTTPDCQACGWTTIGQVNCSRHAKPTKSPRRGGGHSRRTWWQKNGRVLPSIQRFMPNANGCPEIDAEHWREVNDHATVADLRHLLQSAPRTAGHERGAAARSRRQTRAGRRPPRVVVFTILPASPTIIGVPAGWCAVRCECAAPRR